ncbi:Prespore-specific transcriptional regulator RsfA [compost metagenome]
MNAKSWKNNEDEVLANIVFEYKNKGNSLSNAFNEASKKLSRSKSACETRWNKVLKNKSLDKQKREMYLREINQTLATIESEQDRGIDWKNFVDNTESLIAENKRRKERNEKLKVNIDNISRNISYEDKTLDFKDLPSRLNRDVIVETIKLLFDMLEDKKILK